jgi:E3 ubiquitin-protein ligase RFWD2
VSYVAFLSSGELVSASTDSTLRIWDVDAHCSARTLRGHLNEKNFVGLSVCDDYIACGSETNEVVVYYKSISTPTARHAFTAPAGGDESDGEAHQFISAVCWKGEGQLLLAANSEGVLRVLAQAP